jgi:hypothetical protein
MYDDLGDKFNLSKILIIKANLQWKAGDYFGAEKSLSVLLQTIQRRKAIK